MQVNPTVREYSVVFLKREIDMRHLSNLYFTLILSIVFIMAVSCSSTVKIGSPDELPGGLGPSYTDTILSKSCEDLGHEMGSFDMDIGAGQSDITLPIRTNIDSSLEDNLDGLTNEYILDTADTEYILTDDITTPGTAFRIRASNITLNLSGHTITYGTSDSSDSDSYGVYADYNLSGVVIANGNVVQGNGNCVGTSGIGCNPVRIRSGGETIGGLRLEYHTTDTGGIALAGASAEIHHNTLVDSGSVIINRHQGSPAISAGGATGINIHHNLILNSRHRAIDLPTGGTASYNEIYINSYATNAFGVFIWKKQNFEVHHNKVFGSGVHALGVGPMASDAARGKIYSNYFEMENTRFGEEYGNTGSSCLRITWGGDEIEAMCNTCVIRGGNSFPELTENEKSWGRAFWLGGIDEGNMATIHHNYIEALNSDGESYVAGIAVVSGGHNTGLLIHNNTVLANHSAVVLADSYGNAGEGPTFISNKIIRQDEHTNYCTICDRLYGYFDVKGTFLDTVYENSAEISEANALLYFCREDRDTTTELLFGSLSTGDTLIDYFLTEVESTISSGSSSEPFEDACGYKVIP